MSEKNLQANIDYVLKNKEELLKHHRGKFVLVYEESVINSFGDYPAAAQEGIRLYGKDGDFLVHYLNETEPLNFIMEAAF
ncbi:hypothetical protein ACFL6S_09125 [Candidatus Poribacteria bacterium]